MGGRDSPAWELLLISSYVILRRGLHRHFQSSRFSIHLASSFVLSAPASFFSMSTKADVGRPLNRCPCVGTHSTSFLAVSYWCRPASLTAICSDTLGKVPYRCLLVICSSWLMFRTTRSILNIWCSLLC